MAGELIDSDLYQLELDEISAALPLCFRRIYVKQLTESMRVERVTHFNQLTGGSSYVIAHCPWPLSKISEA